MEINGMAHVVLTASNFERSREFYRKLLPFLGLTPMIDTDTFYYCVGGRTAVGIWAPAPEFAGERFEQQRVGLHHLCFRARERGDVKCTVSSARSMQGSFARRGRIRGRPAIIRCCSKILTASGSRSIMFPARDCWPEREANGVGE